MENNLYSLYVNKIRTFEHLECTFSKVLITGHCELCSMLNCVYMPYGK